MQKQWIAGATLALSVTTALANPSITLMGNAKGTYSVPLSNITQLIKQNIDTSANSPYAAIKIQPIYNHNGKINYLLAYLPSKTNYSFSITRINLNQTHGTQYTAGNVINNYHLSTADWQQQPRTKSLGVCPDKNVEFVAATSVPQYPTAKEYVEKVFDDAVSHGYKSVKLEGDEASVGAYENYLSCPNLKGFFNIGHGGPSGIMLSDGMLGSYQFSQMHKELHEKAVILLNSCEVFNDPLKSAVLNGSDPQKYAGGISTLGIGTSEPASACFWDHAFNGKPLTDWLNKCATTIDANDTWGIGGLGGNTLSQA
ncbi:MAG: hypothetical protein P1U63_12260 [Coxiellaceae bacterium]|nr:hypothetical protein [Coxiellaceae bacterium]